MGFAEYNGKIRELGRAILLPTKKIKQIVVDSIAFDKIVQCVDFGAGTMYWSKWLARLCKSVIAVDVIYDDSTKPETNNMICVKELSHVIEGKENCFWICDVLHHLNPIFRKQLVNEVSEKFDYIVIKDIDCNKKFGNMMNHIHDRVINGERINDVDPNLIANCLKQRGYSVDYWYLPRLWYPHFLIVAKKK